MIINEQDLNERMQSPMNLLNRLHALRTPSVKKDFSIPSLPPSADKLIENLDEKIATGSIKNKAAAIASMALDELKSRIPEVHKPEQLAKIASQMAVVINNQPERIQDDTSRPQIIIYAPQTINENTFETVVMND